MDQDFSKFSLEDLEQMVLGQDGIYKFDLYNELYDRYVAKNDIDMAAFAMERLISSFVGEIDSGTLVNARYKQALIYFNAENFSFAAIRQAFARALCRAQFSRCLGCAGPE
jgi:hypothetical protein